MAGVFGRYALLRSLGHGDMADVWKAVLRGPSDFRKVFALKILLEELSAGRDFVDVFVEEARLLGSLAHPNIVQVTDFGEEGGRYFVATEFVHGKDLDAVQKRMAARGAHMPVEMALAIGIDLARALAAAHVRSAPDGSPVLHREVFPKNVLVSYLGEVKLADFRSARVRSVAPAKLVYRSPEQARGEALNRRSDLFSLALLVLDLATGTRPAEGLPRDPASFVFPERETASLPAPTTEVFRKALSLDRNQRFSDAAEMEAAFTDLLGAKGLLETRRSLRSTLERLFAEEMKAELVDDPAAPLPPAAIEAPRNVVARDTVSVPLAPRKRPVGERPSGSIPVPVPPPPPPVPEPSGSGRAPLHPSPTANTAPGHGGSMSEPQASEEWGARREAERPIKGESMETGSGAAAGSVELSTAPGLVGQTGTGAGLAADEEPGTVDGDPPLMRGSFPGENPFDDSVTDTVRKPDSTRVAQPSPSVVVDLSGVNPVPGLPPREPSFKSDLFPKPKPPAPKIPITAIAAGGGALVAAILGFVLVSFLFGGEPGAVATPTPVAVASGEETPVDPAVTEPPAATAAPTRTAAVRQTPAPRQTPKQTAAPRQTPIPRPTATRVAVSTRPPPTPTPVVASGPMGELSVRSKPFVFVWVDGKKLKSTPLVQKLPAGPHKLRFVNDDEEVDLEKDVVVPTNGRVSVTIDLDSGKIEVR